MTPEPQSNSIARAERGDALTLPTLIDEFESDCIGAERNASNIASGGYYATEKHETKKRLVAAVSALNAELEQAKLDRDEWEQAARASEQNADAFQAQLTDMTKQRDAAQRERDRALEGWRLVSRSKEIDRLNNP